ncbi:VOC family protein [Reyranella sp.]|uniref:VOC family protein n=1 Tax=Reyranella sp. TaxID=1929291 RepID=UPI0039C9553A
MLKFDHLNRPVSDLDRSRSWYVATLGLKVEFAAGIIQRHRAVVPGRRCRCDVRSMDETGRRFFSRAAKERGARRSRRLSGASLG